MYMNNDNYLQDFYNYNQMPNNYNPYMNNNCMANMNMMPNQQMMNNMYSNNQNMYSQNNPNDLTNYYPSTYRIINPVVSRVVQNSNYQFLNEDTLNNMVDTVFSIVDGQIDYKDEEVPLQNQAQTSTSANSNSSQTQRQVTEVTRTQTNTTSQNNKNDNLLRDIIKILIIKELLSRRNNQFMNF